MIYISDKDGDGRGRLQICAGVCRRYVGARPHAADHLPRLSCLLMTLVLDLTSI